MKRLRPMPPERLDADARALYDRIVAGPRGVSMLDEEGALAGPFNAMLLSPAVGDALQELGVAIRYRSGLGARARELAILVVAGHWDSAFERQVHEVIAAELGFTEAELAALRAGSPLHLADPQEAAVLRVTRALVGRGDLDEEEYAALPENVLFELTTLVGYYSTLALQLRVFAVQDLDLAGVHGVIRADHGQDSLAHQRSACGCFMSCDQGEISFCEDHRFGSFGRNIGPSARENIT
ncbi:carboxymuconolactone decarboxylase family protein [Nonomuraea sp. LPB2021202275-12-8]|uniref:carboxymuconolactone decarboxylase family protein n=1 Tax=Nonomuraea sp. LPB2021202275-12-8 TaxID=3120159 RepID=UPI00300D258D